jgi:hypothetical protein
MPDLVVGVGRRWEVDIDNLPVTRWLEPVNEKFRRSLVKIGRRHKTQKGLTPHWELVLSVS